MNKYYRKICCLSFILFSYLITYSQVTPVIFSEIFYDSHLNEEHHTHNHHNGEFIELFNPSPENIDISGWKIDDSSSRYTFPENTIFPSRSLLVVAYRYPYSGFTLNSLFSSINTITSPNVFYQDRLILNNNGEKLQLINKTGRVIDEMSYRHRSTFGKKSVNWDICASNGENPDAASTSLVSIQRNNIHYSSSGIASLVDDYTIGTPNPLEINETHNLPYVEKLYSSDEIDTSLPVGSLPGNATVSPTGAATYQIPIECPPGTNGLQPNLSIVYNSQGGSGIMGLGWDIAGLSAISRTPKNMYYDGENGKTIAFDNTDCLTIDGQRLVLLEGDNLAEGAIYGTEFENYSRVKVLKNSGTRLGDPNNHNFIYFELTTKDGTIIEFGSSPDSRLTSANKLPNSENALSWKINRIYDVFRNYLEIKYTNNGQYISEILYVGASRQMKNKISFNYYNNSTTKYKIPIKKSCINGFWLQQDAILDKITIQNESKTRKTYTFNYLQSDRDLRLSSVATFNADNNKLTETKVDWGTENNTFSLVKLESMPDAGLNNVDNSMLYSGDIDGDGYLDKIEMWTGSEKTNEQGYIRVVLKNRILNLIRFNSNTESAEHFTPQLAIGDINNSGKAEIILCERDKITVYGINSTNNNLSKLFESNIDDAVWVNNDKYKYNASLVHYNNDEYLDLIFVPYIKDMQYNPFFDGYEIHSPYSGIAFLGSDNFFLSNELFTITVKDLKEAFGKQMIGDFNADGKIDFMQLSGVNNCNAFSSNSFTISESKSWGLNLYYKPWLADYKRLYQYAESIDFNNDGLTDILVQANSDKNCKIKNSWYILQNNGGHTIEPTRIEFENIHRATSSSNNPAIDRHEPYLIDYNGDGYTDIILGDEVYSKGNYKYTNWYFYKNTKGTFIVDGTNRTYDKLSKMNPIVMDINNDGVQDLVFGSGVNYMAFTIPNASAQYRVKNITNGLGQSYSFAYNNIANPNSSSEPLESILDIHAPMTVVTSYKDKDETITNYEYGVPRLHTKGKGFLGFESITTKTPRMGIKTISTYEINSKYYGMNLKSQEVFALGSNTPISKSTQKNEVIDGNYETNPVLKGIGNINRFMPYISESISTDYTKGTSQTITNLEFDSHWNVTKQESKMGDATKVTETTYTNRNGNGILYLPETIKITQKRKDTPDIITQTNYSGYNLAGQVGTVISYPGTDGQVTTEYIYFPTGNLKEKKITAKGLKAQTTTYRYDTYYRLCTSETNPLNQTAGTTYNYATGDVLTKTDMNGFVTEYKYDKLGRLYKEIQPNGEEINYTTEWTNLNGALYKQTATNTKIINASATFVDKYGREVYAEQTGWIGKKLISSKTYNAKGQLAKAILPHYEEETELYTEYEYNDVLGRVTKEKTFDGKQVLTTDYGYTATTTTITPPDATQKKTEVRDQHGLVVERTDAGGIISYTYNAAGQPLTIISNGSKTEIEYNDYGNQKLLKDPNAGNISFSYYAGGLLETQTNAKGDITEMVYDDYGRLDTKTVTEKATNIITVTKHKYVPSGNGTGQIETIELKEEGNLIHKQTFGYNNHHQPQTVTDEYDNQTVTFSNTYDALWRPATSISPSGLITTNRYNEYGDLDAILCDNSIIWEGKEQNSKGQFSKFNLGNGLSTVMKYSDRGEVENIKTRRTNSQLYIQNNIYTYFEKTGNLYTRSDLKNRRSEEFAYDDLNRLTKAWLNGELIHDMTYHPNGNIDTKSDVGTYRYDTPRPHAMSGIDNVGEGVTNQKQFIDYTSFNKVSRIRQGLNENSINRVYDIFYGLDEQRIKTVYDDILISGHIKTRYYFGSYEKDIDEFGHVTHIDYIYSPTGLTLIVKNGTKYYTHTDLLGSIERITNAAGSLVSEYTYTPWGGRILLSGVNITDRGYTGHEHLSPFGNDTNGGFCLINMNGRIYDPVLARFLSPDPYVQAPDFTQSYNRYAYALNNPFKYVDPSGNVILEAMLIGGAINLVSQIIAGNVSDFGDAFTAFGIGALGGLAGAGAGILVGNALGAAMTMGGAIANGAITGAAGGAAGGFVGGAGNAWFNGANFGDGLKSGLISGGIGAIGGGVIGGISGGIQFQKSFKFFIKGCQELEVNPSEAVDATDIFLSDAQKVWYPDAPMDKVKKFTVQNASGQFTGDNTHAGGMTRALSIDGKLTGNSNVYFNKDEAFTSAFKLYNVMGHEFVHVSQIASLANQSVSLLKDQIFRELMEFHAYNYRSVNNFSSFSKEDVLQYMKQYPTFYESLHYFKFPWTSNSNFTYPF